MEIKRYRKRACLTDEAPVSLDDKEAKFVVPEIMHVPPLPLRQILRSRRQNNYLYIDSSPEDNDRKLNFLLALF
ncbi:hypothetical protein KIN20_007170 [Parelaphostrongylus tenuis]|uniref:Uncharacterized protein n=1 Tax=Parelaphostrongylus tenuis TaxID=148309 RepID=A0AAD5M516_PARTN|nr:hypothetical protein KIN20_007170 [Parelaphostrongylus tenuis]